jgi:hypothetical protein
VHLEAAGIEQAARWLDSRRLRLEERYQRLDEVLAGLACGDQSGEPFRNTGDTSTGSRQFRERD